MKENFSASQLVSRASLDARAPARTWPSRASAQQAAPPLSPAEAIKIANDAYIYGYSLITTEVTRVQDG